MKKLSLLITLTSLWGVAHAQTEEQRKKIISNYDANKIEQIKKEFKQLQEQRNASRKTSTFPKFIKSTETGAKNTAENYFFAELQYIDNNGTPIYYQTYNSEAGKSTRTNYLQSGGELNLNLKGKDMLVGVWDAGGARSTHQEYKNASDESRYSSGDDHSLDSHSAHVTGTIIAKGEDKKAKGMAVEAQAIGYNWTEDITEMAHEAGEGLLLSNHSYGYSTKKHDIFGNLIYTNNQTVPLLEWYYFGTYLTDAYNLDKLLYAAPSYLAVVAAGNDGIFYVNKKPMDSSKPQYDKLTGFGNSKNALIVANAEKAVLNADGSLKSVTINSTSSQGPTKDLRIKPDITGHGTDVYSTFKDSDSSYGTMSGTSMASPNVTGSLLLIQEHAKKTLAKYLEAATLKGLALHTADDAGLTGPDAIFGWGLLNAKKMAETVTEAKNNTNTITEASLKNAQTFTKVVKAKAGSKLSVSISWTDPEGKAIKNTDDVNNPTLVNDLDLRVTKGNKTYYPWKLTGVASNSDKSDNNKDNFERVDIDNATAEEYTITVSHKGTLKDNENQAFALIITGIENNVNKAPTAPTNLKTNNLKSTTTDIIFTPGTDDVGVVGYDIYLNNSKIRENYSAINLINFFDLVPNTSYTIELASVDKEGLRSPKSQSLTFKTLAPVANTAPTAPTNLKVTSAQSTLVNFSFTPGTDDKGIVGYDMYIDNTLIGEKITTTNNSLQVYNLEVNKSYNLEIASVDQEGLRSPRSVKLAFKTVDTDAPTTPTNLSVTRTPNNTSNIEIKWGASTDNVAVTKYKVYLDLYTFEVNAKSNSIVLGPIADGARIVKVTAIDAANNESAAVTNTYQHRTNNSIPTLINDTGISIYPNPTADILNIKGVKENASFKIYNLAGSLVISGSTSSNQNIDVSKLSAGVYILELLTDNKEGNKIRFIKK